MTKKHSSIIISSILFSGFISNYSFSYEQNNLIDIDNKPTISEYKELKHKISVLSKENRDLSIQNDLLTREIISYNLINSKSQTQEKIINSIINSDIKQLQRQLETKATNDSIEILSKSFYERLRTTDDSVSMWGTVTGWFGVLITLILASMALLHFGRFRELKNETKQVLDEARRNSRMSANAAVTRAGNEANKLVNHWLNEKGIKEIDRKISEFNQQIHLAKEKLSHIDGTLAEANTSIDEIRKKGQSLQQSPNKEAHHHDNKKYLSIVPSQRNLDNTLPLINEYFNQQEFRYALVMINMLLKHNKFNKNDILTLNIYKTYTLSKLNLHTQAVLVYLSKCSLITNRETFDTQLVKVNLYVVINSIIYSLTEVNDYDKAKETLEMVLDYLLESKYKYNDIEYFVNLANMIDQHYKNNYLVNKYLPQIIELFKSSDKIFFELERAKLSFELEKNRNFIFDVNDLISKATDIEDFMKAYITITDHFSLKNEHERSLDYFNEVNVFLTKDHKARYRDLYLYLLINRAYCLSFIGKKKNANRIGRYVKYHVEKTRLYLDDRGKKELEITLGLSK